jgi:uncharacterized protein YbjT (DUF2867 family)/uncharacterized protein YndB with AHSA1/START domain
LVVEVRDVLVTGGTGRLGRRVVDRLRAEGIEPRVMSRSGRPGTIEGDLLTGEGIEAAVCGADTIIHAAQSPTRKSRRTAVEGTERLLEIAARAGVSHFVYISVVGLERVPLSYYREKLAAERLVERSPVAWTILRSTQFHEFVLSMVRALNRVPFVTPVPKGWLFQPIDTGEVAGRLVELALELPAGRVPDIAGPEVRTLAGLTQAYLTARGSKKGVVELPIPGKAARVFREGAQAVPASAWGDITWEEFLERQGGIMQYPETPTRERKTGMLNGLFYSGPSIEALHEQYAKKGRIDQEAPVKASREFCIEAPVERVWELLSDPRGWEAWYPDVHDVRLEPGVEEDARFAWANGKAHMRSRFAIVEVGREITWTGVAYGAKAVHRHVLQPTEGGATRVFSEESMAGPLLVLFYNSARLRAEMEEWLSALKIAAEAPAEER